MNTCEKTSPCRTGSILGGICASISAGTVAEAIDLARVAQASADVIEIRLDQLARPEAAPFMKEIACPLLFTCRPTWEGGAFDGEEKDRERLLLEAVSHGAALIDLEMKTEAGMRDRLLAAARASQTRMIVSWHDFRTTPSSQALRSVLQEQYRSGAAIGKIVTTARTTLDTLRVLDLHVEAAEVGFPLCAFCMGRAGVMSRIATLALGGFMTYAAPERGRQAAPGQLTCQETRGILETLNATD